MSGFGGGGGFAPGGGGGEPVIDRTFDDAAARDAYYNAPDPHLDELVKGETRILLLDDGSGNAVVEVWGGETNPAVYDNTNWKPLTTTNTLPGDTTGQSLAWNNTTNKWEPSDELNIGSTKVESTVKFEVPPGSVQVGQTLDIGSAGTFPIYNDLATGNKFFPTFYQYDDTGVVQKAFEVELGAETQEIVQPVSDTTMPLSGTFGNVPTENQFVQELQLKSPPNTTVNGLRLRVRVQPSDYVVFYFPSKEKWDTSVGEDKLSDGSGIIKFDIRNSPLSLQGLVSITIDYAYTGGSLLGNSSNVPYNAIIKQTGPIREIATEKWVTDNFHPQGATKFIDLTDTPNDYSVSQIQNVVVNPTESEIQYKQAELTPLNDEVLKYDESTSKWVNDVSPTGVTKFTELTDTPDNYSFPGQKFVIANPLVQELQFQDINIEDLNNVQVSAPASGEILEFESTIDKWVNNEPRFPVALETLLTDGTFSDWQDSQLSLAFIDNNNIVNIDTPDITREKDIIVIYNGNTIIDRVINVNAAGGYTIDGGTTYAVPIQKLVFFELTGTDWGFKGSTPIINDLSIKSVTDLVDVTDAGSGEIITDSERAKLESLDSGNEPRIEVDNFTITDVNLSDYNFTLVDCRKSTGSLLVSLLNISAYDNAEIQFEFTNNSPSKFVVQITPDGGQAIGGKDFWTLKWKESIVINKPTSGNTNWLIKSFSEQDFIYSQVSGAAISIDDSYRRQYVKYGEFSYGSLITQDLPSTGIFENGDRIYFANFDPDPTNIVNIIPDVPDTINGFSNYELRGAGSTVGLVVTDGNWVIESKDEYVPVEYVAVTDNVTTVTDTKTIEFDEGFFTVSEPVSEKALVEWDGFGVVNDGTFISNTQTLKFLLDQNLSAEEDSIDENQTNIGWLGVNVFNDGTQITSRDINFDPLNFTVISDSGKAKVSFKEEVHEKKAQLLAHLQNSIYLAPEDYRTDPNNELLLYIPDFEDIGDSRITIDQELKKIVFDEDLGVCFISVRLNSRTVNTTGGTGVVQMLLAYDDGTTITDVFGNTAIAEIDPVEGLPFGELWYRGIIDIDNTKGLKFLISGSNDIWIEFDGNKYGSGDLVIEKLQSDDNENASLALTRYMKDNEVIFDNDFYNYIGNIHSLSNAIDIHSNDRPVYSIATDTILDIDDGFKISAGDGGSVDYSMEEKEIKLNPGLNLTPFNINRIFDKWDTLAFRGKTLTLFANVRPEENAYNIVVAKWTGPYDMFTSAIITNISTGTYTYEPGWSEVDKIFVAEDPGQPTKTVSKSVSIPSDANNIAIFAAFEDEEGNVSMYITDLKLVTGAIIDVYRYECYDQRYKCLYSVNTSTVNIPDTPITVTANSIEDINRIVFDADTGEITFLCEDCYLLEATFNVDVTAGLAREIELFLEMYNEVAADWDIIPNSGYKREIAGSAEGGLTYVRVSNFKEGTKIRLRAQSSSATGLRLLSETLTNGTVVPSIVLAVKNG